jgi:hypothetical protein
MYIVEKLQPIEKSTGSGLSTLLVCRGWQRRVNALLGLVQKDRKLQSKILARLRLQTPLILYRRAHPRNQIFEALNRSIKVIKVLPEQAKEFCVGASRHMNKHLRFRKLDARLNEQSV